MPAPLPMTGAVGPAAPTSPPAYSDIMNSLIGSITAPSLKGMQGAFGNSPIVNGFTNMLNSANQANATRGQNILKLLQGQGTAQMAQNQQNFQQQEAGISQDMMSKGLANTSVGSNLNQEAVNQLAQANEGVSEHAALDMANMANSFNQQGPSMQMLANLLSQGGNRGGGGGGGLVFNNSPYSAGFGSGGGQVTGGQPGYVTGGGNNNYGVSTDQPSYDEQNQLLGQNYADFGG